MASVCAAEGSRRGDADGRKHNEIGTCINREKVERRLKRWRMVSPARQGMLIDLILLAIGAKVVINASSIR